MKNASNLFLTLLFVVIYSTSSAQELSTSSNSNIPENKNLSVIELRNYLVRPNDAEKFNAYFTEHFLKPMQDMGVAVWGKFKIKNNNDHFVWIRGYDNMAQRVKFLNDFYYHNEEWKKYKKGANDMIRNSDNVYLLTPLDTQGEIASDNALGTDKPFATVDFYIANTRLNELTALYTKEYMPILTSLGIVTTLWVSESTPNDFPQLPVFQDKNLLVAITFYTSEKEYRLKAKQIESKISDSLKTKLQDVVTTHNVMLLNRFNQGK